MNKYQRDVDGTTSCKHRLPDDLHPISWCSQSKELCCHNANCRVPILTPLFEVVKATEALVEASERLVRLMERRGYGAYDLAAARTASDNTRTVLKSLERA